VQVRLAKVIFILYRADTAVDAFQTFAIRRTRRTVLGLDSRLQSLKPVGCRHLCGGAPCSLTVELVARRSSNRRCREAGPDVMKRPMKYDAPD
jgi:hypothetical protein